MNTGRTDVPASAQSGTRLALATLCVAAFFAAMNFIAASPFYADMADDLDTTVPLLGQLATVMLLISAALGLFVGPLADRYGIRWLLTLGMGAISLNLLGTAATPSYTMLVPLAVVGALGDALVFGLAFALVSTIFAAEARRRAIGWTMASLSVAPVLGVPILTTIGGFSGWRMAIGIAGTLAVAATWMVIAVLPADDRRPNTPLRVRALFDAYAPVRAHSATKRLLAVTVLRAGWMFGLLTYIGAYLRDDLGESTERVGLYYMVAGVGTTLGSLAGGSRLAAIAPRPTIAAANVIGGVLTALVLWSPAPVVMLLLPLLAMVGVLASVSITALLAVESPAQAGTTMVLNASLLNLGAAVGAAAGGGLLAVGGYHAMALGLPIFAAAAALMVWPQRADMSGPMTARTG